MYPEMAAEDLITLDELRGKLAHLRDIRATAEHEPEEVRGRAESITELERDRDTLLESYKALAVEELDDLTPEERHDFYRTLHVVVFVHAEGGIEVTDEFLPFDTRSPDNPPDDAPGGNGGASSASPEFSTNTNTRACAVAAKDRRASADHPRLATPAARTLFRPRVGCPDPPPAARPVFGGGTSGRSCTATDAPSAEASCGPLKVSPKCKVPTYTLKGKMAATTSGMVSVCAGGTTGPWMLAGSL
jgi:hypothetical protein